MATSWSSSSSTAFFSSPSTSGASSSPSLQQQQHHHQHPYDDIDSMVENWKDNPRINPTIEIPTLLIPSKDMKRWMNDQTLQEYKLTHHNHDVLPHIHPRIKFVHDYDNNSNEDDEKLMKQVLLSPGTTKDDLRDILHHDDDQEDNKKEDSSSSSSSFVVEWGPPYVMNVSYNQLSFSYILNQLIPKIYSASSQEYARDVDEEDEVGNTIAVTTEDANTRISKGNGTKEPKLLLPPPSAYEQIGHIAHFNLKPYHLPYATLIGEVLLETNPSIEIVVNKVGQVKGKYRTYDYQILASSSPPSAGDGANEDLLETTVSEHGISIQVNVAECYWCTRLSGERQALLRDILPPNGQNNKKDDDPLVIADIFCGVGAQLLLLAKKSNNPQKCFIKANDWNPAALRCLESSIIQNNLNPSQFELTQKDAYDFLMDLGSSPTTTTTKHKSPYRRRRKKKGDGKSDKESNGSIEKQEEVWSLPDHILMNYPLEGPTFLGALRWWPTSHVDDYYERKGTYPRFHIYTFASRRSSTSASTKKDNDRQAEENAVDVIANELLPWSSSSPSSSSDDNEDEEGSGAATTTRHEMNQEFDANVHTRLVRDVAPGKVVVLVSFSLTPKLVRYMQGSFSD